MEPDRGALEFSMRRGGALPLTGPAGRWAAGLLRKTVTTSNIRPLQKTISETAQVAQVAQVAQSAELTVPSFLPESLGERRSNVFLFSETLQPKTLRPRNPHE